MPWWIKSKAGVTLIELLVGLGVFLIIGTALFALLQGSLKLVNADQNRTAALAIARKKLEVIKNLPYDDVGTMNGIPSGALQQGESEVLNHVTYSITTDIRYVDDNFDQLAPTDTLNTDYKRVQVTVTWDQAPRSAPVTLVTNIVPTSIETTATGGTLWIEVYDPTTDPVSRLKNVDVTITAPSLNISISGKTDSDGRYIVPGMPPATEAYHVTVSKENYSTDQTYARDLETNPNPNPANLSVAAGEVTTQYFEISKKVNLLAVHLQRADDHAHVVAPFQIHGTKTIGTDGEGLPIYKYSAITTTPNNGGNAEIHDLESDTYTILFDEASIGYVVAGYDHVLPYTIAPQGAETITIDLADYQPYTALITVTDNANLPVAGATVTLGATNLITNDFGQAFFPGLVPNTYTLTISKSGYTTYTGTAIVNGNEQQTIGL